MGCAAIAEKQPGLAIGAAVEIGEGTDLGQLQPVTDKGGQIEHRVPIAKGGTHTIDNLELLCANHNRFRAVQAFGLIKMRRYIPSLE